MHHERPPGDLAETEPRGKGHPVVRVDDVELPVPADPLHLVGEVLHGAQKIAGIEIPSLHVARVEEGVGRFRMDRLLSIGIERPADPLEMEQPLRRARIVGRRQDIAFHTGHDECDFGLLLEKSLDEAVAGRAEAAGHVRGIFPAQHEYSHGVFPLIDYTRPPWTHTEPKADLVERPLKLQFCRPPFMKSYCSGRSITRGVTPSGPSGGRTGWRNSSTRSLTRSFFVDNV